MSVYSCYPGNKVEKITYDPLEEEKTINEFWTKEKVWDKVHQFRCENNNGKFSILNGPTFRNGSPHSGHILNALLKDIYTRYAHQKNLEVINRFGWDCHGIAIEHDVDKKLDINQPEDFYCLGPMKYNEECRKFVEKHHKDWKENFNRIGIMVDIPGAYSTMSLENMEGVWAVFKKLFDKGLVYKDKKVLPYSSGCFSHLSHFEAEQNWKNVNAVCALVAFQILDSDECLLVLTDCPWKLGANFAMGVNPVATYVKIQIFEDQRKFILSKSQLASVFPHSNAYTILDEFEGECLQGLKYLPLFDYLAGSFTIITDNSVSDKQGTGIVALCPHFNQNEYRICHENGLFPNEVLCPIDRCGRFTRSITELAGLTIGEATVAVVQTLQQRRQLVQLRNVTKKMRHCWRSDVPLFEKITSTWFLKVENLKKKLRENNSQVTWVPSSNKQLIENQFNKLKDWPVGRLRFWGTPIPIWSSPSGDEIRCIGSIRELLELTKANKITDLHMEFIDKLTIPSSVPGNPPLRRIPEVFDCWFESGAMPFNRASQLKHQADIITEGQDQLNGWFMAMSILSAALDLPAPSKTVVSHGFVHGPDGLKLSKRKCNSNDAIMMAEKYGADAMRMYLASTPIASGQSMTLNESEVLKFREKIFQPFYKLLCDIVPLFGKPGMISYGYANETTYYENLFEKWILFRCESVVQFYESELKNYRFNLIVPKVIEFLEDFYKWYIPLKKILFRNTDQDIYVTFGVIYKICLVLAPFAPYYTEFIYKVFKPLSHARFSDYMQNVLLTDKSEQLIDLEVELQFSRWKSIVEMVREARKQHIIPVGYRINELIVVHPIEHYLDSSEEANKALKKIVNVHQITRTADRAQFGIRLKAKLKKDSSLKASLSKEDFHKIASVIQNLDDKEVGELVRVGSEDILGQLISIKDVEISHISDQKLDERNICICRDDVFIIVKMNKNLDYYEEGTRKEMISVVQKFRKKAKVYPSEVITLRYSSEDSCIEFAFIKFAEELWEITNSKIQPINLVCDKNEEKYFQETVDIKGSPVILFLYRKKEIE